MAYIVVNRKIIVSVLATVCLFAFLSSGIRMGVGLLGASLLLGVPGVSDGWPFEVRDVATGTNFQRQLPIFH